MPVSSKLNIILADFYWTSNKLSFSDYHLISRDGISCHLRVSFKNSSTTVTIQFTQALGFSRTVIPRSYTKRSEDRLHVEVESTSSPLNYDRPLDLNKLLCFLCLYQLSPAILRSNLFRDSIWIEFAKSTATKLLHQIATFLNYVFYNNLPQTVLS